MGVGGVVTGNQAEIDSPSQPCSWGPFLFGLPCWGAGVLGGFLLSQQPLLGSCSEASVLVSPYSGLLGTPVHRGRGEEEELAGRAGAPGRSPCTSSMAPAHLGRCLFEFLLLLSRISTNSVG